MSAAKKKSPKKSTKRRGKAGAVRLTVDEKQQKAKPGDDLNEFVDEVLTAWAPVSTKVRVPDVSAARLRSLLKKAQKAGAKESALRAAQAEKLAPLVDARLIANDAVYRAALAVKRVADAVAETQPAVADAFAPVNERFKSGPRKASEPG
jgi:hypothetical protein